MLKMIGVPEEDKQERLPDTSLLICSRNRSQLLTETIQSILAGNEIPSEIVIIDQSDAPDPGLVVFQPERDCVFHYLWNNTIGVSRGRNSAVSSASHSILVFTDDDMLVSPDWFGTLVRSLVTAGDQSIITGQVLSSNEGNFHGYAPSTRTDNDTVIYSGRINRDVLFTNNMAICRSTFESIGGFDTMLGPGTLFPAAEDNDLAFRLLEEGYQIVYEPKAVAYHRPWRSEAEYVRLYWLYGFGQGAFYAKYFNLQDRFMIKRMAWDVWSYLSRFPLRFWKRRMQAYQDALFVAGLLFGAIKWSLHSTKKQTWLS
jgi:O-antigen biosynthesis protein